MAPFAGEEAGELAYRLLARFGSLAAIVAAPAAQLREAAGDLADAVMQICAARLLFDTAKRDSSQSGQVYPVSSAMLGYLRGIFGRHHRERIHVIFGDAQHAYLGDETLADGDASLVRVQSELLLKRAREIGASGLVLAHNHPSGNCRPSKSDVSATRRFSGLAEAAGVTLLDHLILTETKAYSMKVGGQL